MTLFQLGSFVLHSGEQSRWKIECDALTDGDLAALALMASEVLPGPFGALAPIPRGGSRLALAMGEYVQPPARTVLVVDDVLTTGASMEQERARLELKGRDVLGLVIFARGRCPAWITPLFRLWMKR